jgi:DNA-binding NarL/FixJ family response regulator
MNRVRIAIVDDQELVRTGLSTIFSAHDDLEVVGEGEDGDAALALVRRTDPDVLLIDVRMPRVDGVTATRAVVASGARARVCVLTTYDQDEFVYDALAAGASGFLLKTDPPERIVRSVRDLATGELALSAATADALVARFVGGARPSPADEDPLAALTARERSVYLLVAQGLTNREIAERLFLGEGTVKSHVAHVLTKLDLRDRVHVVIHAHRNHLV